MFRKKPIKLGVCPIGKFAFSHEDAIVQKNKLFEKLRALSIDFIALEGVLPDGIVRKVEDVDPVVRYMGESAVDAIFLPHCNFGTESAAGLIPQKLNLPALLWGPRDDAPFVDGSRLRDSLCGCFASSKVLSTLGVNYEYIESSRVDDPVFEGGITSFIDAIRVAKAFRTARIGQIGMRIDFFWSTIIDESDLLKKFGIEVLPFDMVEFIERFKNRYRKDEATYKAELRDLAKRVEFGQELESGVLVSLALRDELFEMAEKYQVDAFALQSFSSVQDAMGPGSGVGLALAEDRIPVSAETDIHGALGSVLAEAAANNALPSFFPEFTVRHPTNDNVILLWHASAPLSLMHTSIPRAKILPPWILKSLPPTSLQFRLKDGDLTVCRFDGTAGEYVLGLGEGCTTDGPYTRELYCWMETGNWPAWERRLIKGPYVHHCSAVYGKYASVLEKSAKYIPSLRVEWFDT